MTSADHKRRPRRFDLPLGRVGEVPRQVLPVDPAQSDYSARPRMIAVRGPAGYGKTTLIAQVGRKLQERGARVAWLTCDEDDSDLQQLISSIAQAVSFAGINAAEDDASDVEKVASLWKAQFDACLILDDFEKAATPETERFIERLFDRLNPQFLIIIGTRQPLGSWFLRREVAGEALSVGASSLRFNEAEIRSIIPHSDETELAEIEANTEGWPFAIQLIALRQKRGEIVPSLFSATGDSSGLFDYLSEQVMVTLSDEQRRLLYDIAVLGHVDAEMVDAIVGRTDSASVIRSLQHLEPIMSASAENPPFLQLHPLFSHYLSTSGAANDERRASLLRRRAAQFFEQKGELGKAIRHAVDADDGNLTEAIIARAGNELAVIDHGAGRMATLIARIPEPFRTARPGLDMIEFVIAAVTARGAVVTELANILRRGPLPPLHSEWPSEQWSAYADTLIIVASAFCADLDVSDALNRLRRYFEDSDSFVAREPRARTLLCSFQTLLCIRQGRNEEARASLLEYQHLCQATGAASRQPSINPQRGLIAFAEGDFEQARLYFDRSADLRLDDFGSPEPLLSQYCRIMRGRLLYEQGRPQEAAAILEKVQLAQNATLPDMTIQYWYVRMLAAVQIDQTRVAASELEAAIAGTGPEMRLVLQAIALEASLHLGHPPVQTTIERLRGRMEQIISSPLPCIMELERIARGLIPAEIILGSQQAVLPLLDRALEISISANQPLVAGQMHLLRAEAHQASGLSPRADMISALEQRCPVQAFRDIVRISGHEILPALGQSGSAETGEHVRNILRGSVISIPALHRLTDREKDIAIEALVRTSNKDIARSLDLSPETVKHHLRNIFTKLGVHSREEAAFKLTTLP